MIFSQTTANRITIPSTTAPVSVSITFKMIAGPISTGRSCWKKKKRNFQWKWPQWVFERESSLETLQTKWDQIMQNYAQKDPKLEEITLKYEFSPCITENEYKPCQFQTVKVSKRWLRCLNWEFRYGLIIILTNIWVVCVIFQIFFISINTKLNFTRLYPLEVAKVIGDWFQHPQSINELLNAMWINATKIDPNSVAAEDLSNFLYSITLSQHLCSKSVYKLILLAHKPMQKSPSVAVLWIWISEW